MKGTVHFDSLNFYQVTFTSSLATTYETVIVCLLYVIESISGKTQKCEKICFNNDLKYQPIKIQHMEIWVTIDEKKHAKFGYSF